MPVLTATMMRARNQRRQRLLRSPYAWSVPRPVESWFDLHYYDPTVHQDFFRQQLCVTRNTFNCIFNMLNHRLVQQRSHFTDPFPLEKILALGLYRLGHGNLYVSIWSSFNVGKVTVIEAVQDVGGIPLQNTQITHKISGKWPQKHLKISWIYQT